MPYILQENKNLYGQVIESGELVANGSYFSTGIAHSIWYVTPIEGNIKTIKSLITVIKSGISLNKIKAINELTPFLKYTNKEELSLR